jgi:hypothetical protein
MIVMVFPAFVVALAVGAAALVLDSLADNITASGGSPRRESAPPMTSGRGAVAAQWRRRGDVVTGGSQPEKAKKRRAQG